MDPPPGTFVALTDLPARLSEAQQRWQDAGITDYCITVEYIAFIANAGSRTLEVRDGNIIAGPRLCIGPSNNCLTEGEHGYDYTVPGLFALLQRELNDPGRQVDLIAFDATYGYPIWISTNTSMRGVTDLGRMWTVTSFIPLT